MGRDFEILVCDCDLYIPHGYFVILQVSLLIVLQTLEFLVIRAINVTFVNVATFKYPLGNQRVGAGFLIRGVGLKLPPLPLGNRGGLETEFNC